MNTKNSKALDRDQFRANLLHYTRRAFRMLLLMAEPRILDISSGSGVSTLELVRLSGGNVVAVDIDREMLDKLINKAASEGLSSKITVVQSSMLEMNFPPNSFDIIWTEGAVEFIGFERGLREWRGLLSNEGYLVVHDVLSDLQHKVRLSGKCGYTIMGQFELSPDVWWNEYYAPLKKHIEAMQKTRSLERRVTNDLKAAVKEIEEFDRESDRFGSVFFILKKV